MILGITLSFAVGKYQSDQNDNRVIHRQLTKIISVSLPDLIKGVSPSVVYVKAPGMWSGSGVIVGPHIILTARHVIKNAHNITVRTANGEVHEAISWVVDEENDCGLLFFDPREEFGSIAKFADSDKLQIGDKIFTVGSPFGKDFFNTVTFGIISGLDRDISFFGEDGLLTSDAAINPGNSGGPIFNMQGRIIGIGCISIRYSNRFSILILANICKDLLENKKSNEVEIDKTDEAASKT